MKVLELKHYEKRNRIKIKKLISRRVLLSWGQLFVIFARLVVIDQRSHCRTHYSNPMQEVYVDVWIGSYMIWSSSPDVMREGCRCDQELTPTHALVVIDQRSEQNTICWPNTRDVCRCLDRLNDTLPWKHAHGPSMAVLSSPCVKAGVPMSPPCSWDCVERCSKPSCDCTYEVHWFLYRKQI